MKKRVSKERYFEFLQRMVENTHSSHFDKERYAKLVVEICNEYHLAKGVTEFYTTPMKEKQGDGEIFCDFDNGKAKNVLVRISIESLTKAVVYGTIYIEDEVEDHDPEEIEQLKVMLGLILGLVARRRLVRVLEEFGFYDLDGFRNFRSFARFLDIKNVENRLGGMVAFHIDLHNFNMVNREIGRRNGDVVLKNYYNLLSDAIGESGIVAHLGGDKFIGIFARKDKRKIFDIFAGVPVPYGDVETKRIRVAASAGIFMLPDPYILNSYGDIMDKIMMAGSTAKRQASGGIVIYDDRMKLEKEHIKKIQSAFRGALENEEFAVYYQPKVDIESKRIIGSEALCRWIKNDVIIPPMEFIPVLEMNTEICDLDFYMLDHVCSDIRRWLDEGREVVRVSVNLSRKHLVDMDLLEHIISIIDKHKVPHEYIEVELTETTTDVLFSDLKRVVCGLNNVGIWTAVDDFGVGYSSLTLIRDIPWNVLKVDKSFVPKSYEDENSISNLMFKHVTSLAHDMGLEIVIEGVESLDQLEVLRRNNCNIAQGYFFDRPLPLADYEMRLDTKVYTI